MNPSAALPAIEALEMPVVCNRLALAISQRCLHRWLVLKALEFQAVVAENLARRQKEVQKVLQIVDSECQEFSRYLDGRKANARRVVHGVQHVGCEFAQ